MRRTRAAAMAAISLLAAAGCATRMPQTAEEFRQAAPGAFTAKTEELTVQRRFRDVAAALQKNGPECLKGTLTRSHRAASSPHLVTAYKPTVLVSAERAELHLQEDHLSAGVLKVHEQPNGGYYVMVVDAYPLPDNRTRVQIFRPAMGYDVVVRAIKGWATGEVSGCPDLTKIG